MDDEGCDRFWCVFLNHYTGDWIERSMIRRYTIATANTARSSDDVTRLEEEEKTLLAGLLRKDKIATARAETTRRFPTRR